MKCYKSRTRIGNKHVNTACVQYIINVPVGTIIIEIAHTSVS